jgi:hypothetical protein
MGAALYTSDRRSGSMHGKSFPLDSVYAGIDADNLYGRLDFAGSIPSEDMTIVVNAEFWAPEARTPQSAFRLDVNAKAGKIISWKATPEAPGSSGNAKSSGASGDLEKQAAVALVRQFEFKLPLSLLAGSTSGGNSGPAPTGPVPPAGKVRLRFSLWQNRLPVDALPVEGWIELQLLSEDELMASA